MSSWTTSIVSLRNPSSIKKKMNEWTEKEKIVGNLIAKLLVLIEI